MLAEDPYEALGVLYGDDRETIRKAYTKLARLWHPDAHEDSDKALAEDKMKSVTAAWRAISTMLSSRLRMVPLYVDFGELIVGEPGPSLVIRFTILGGAEPEHPIDIENCSEDGPWSWSYIRAETTVGALTETVVGEIACNLPATQPIGKHTEDLRFAVGDDAVTVTLAVTSLPVPIPAPVVELAVSSKGLTATATVKAIDPVDSKLKSPLSFLWSWDGHPPAKAGTLKSSHSFPASGTYDVSVTVTNEGGSTTVTKSVTVHEPPSIAGLTLDSDGLRVTIAHVDVTSDGHVTYMCNWGDGSKSSASLTHTYTRPGAFPLVVIATNSGGSVTYSELVTVNHRPVISDFKLQINELKVTVAVAIASDTTATFLYSWDDDTLPSSSPSHTYVRPGTYNVSAMATNVAGSDCATKSVAVDRKPVIGRVDIELDELNVTVSNVQVVSDSNPTLTFDWGDGTPPSTIFSHTYRRPGTYQVKCTAKNVAGSSEKLEVITVDKRPVISDFCIVTTELNVVVDEISIPLETTAVYSFEWGDGSPTSSVPSHRYSDPGIFNLKVVATNLGGTHALTRTVALDRKPIVGHVDIELNELSVTVSYVNVVSHSSPTLTFDWGDGTPPTPEQTHTYQRAGEYLLIVTAVNVAASDKKTENVTVNRVPVISNFVLDTDELMVTLDSVEIPTNATATYVCDWGDGTKPSSALAHPYAEPGNYIVTVRATNSAGSHSSDQRISVDRRPVFLDMAVQIDELDVTILSVGVVSHKSPDLKFSWDDISPVSSARIHTYPGPGTYELVVTATNIAGSRSMTKRLIVNQTPVISDFQVHVRGLHVTIGDVDVPAGTEPTLVFDWGDGFTSDVPSHTYDDRGYYCITVTATNACGSHTATRYVHVNRRPVISRIVAEIDGLEVRVTRVDVPQQAEPSLAYDWGDGTPIRNEPFHTYARSDTYTLLVQATNAGGSESSTEIITVHRKPVVLGYEAQIEDLRVSIADIDVDSEGPTSLEFDWGDGTEPSLPCSHTYARRGTYELKVTAHNRGGSGSALETVTVRRAWERKLAAALGDTRARRPALVVYFVLAGLLGGWLIPGIPPFSYSAAIYDTRAFPLLFRLPLALLSIAASLPLLFLASFLLHGRRRSVGWLIVCTILTAMSVPPNTILWRTGEERAVTTLASTGPPRVPQECARSEKNVTGVGYLTLVIARSSDNACTMVSAYRGWHKISDGATETDWSETSIAIDQSNGQAYGLLAGAAAPLYASRLALVSLPAADSQTTLQVRIAPTWENRLGPVAGPDGTVPITGVFMLALSSSVTQGVLAFGAQSWPSKESSTADYLVGLDLATGRLIWEASCPSKDLNINDSIVHSYQVMTADAKSFHIRCNVNESITVDARTGR